MCVLVQKLDFSACFYIIDLASPAWARRIANAKWRGGSSQLLLSKLACFSAVRTARCTCLSQQYARPSLSWSHTAAHLKHCSSAAHRWYLLMRSISTMRNVSSSPSNALHLASRTRSQYIELVLLHLNAASAVSLRQKLQDTRRYILSLIHTLWYILSEDSRLDSGMCTFQHTNLEHSKPPNRADNVPSDRLPLYTHTHALSVASSSLLFKFV